MRVIRLIILFYFLSSALKAQLTNQYKQYLQRSTQENPAQLVQELEALDSLNDESYLLLAELNYFAGNNEASLEILDELINRLKTNKQTSSYINTRALSITGLVYWNEGKFTKATNYLLEALKIQEANSSSNLNLADTYNNLGLVSKNNEPESAKIYFEKALSLATADSSQMEKVVYISINIALLELKASNDNAALSRLNLILEEWRRNHEAATPIEAFISLNLGEIYFKKGAFTLASDYVESAISIYKDFYGEHNSELANAYLLMANISLAQNKFELALQFNSYALRANSLPSEADYLASNNPLSKEALKPSYQLVILINKADIFEKYYFGYSLKKGHLMDALEAIKAADELVSLIRKNTTNKLDQQQLNKDAALLYEKGQRICLFLDEISLFKTDYLKHAFEFSEKSKANSLLNAVAESNAKSFAGIPIEKIDEENQLKNTIGFYTTQLAKNAKSDGMEGISSSLFNAQKLYEEFILELELDYPAYYELKYQNKLITVEELQASLADNALVISYSYDEANNNLHQYIISKEKFKINKIDGLAEIQKLINAYRNLLTYKVKPGYSTIAHELYKKLFPSRIPNHINHLTIIPEGELGIIPFEALITSKTDHKNYADFDFLIKEFAIAYDYSATLNVKKVKNDYGTNTVIVAPINFNEVGVNTLAASESEANMIASLFKEQGYTNRLLSYDNATESNFRKLNTDGYKFIHLATHGLVNPVNPDLSAIYLNNVDDGLHDGKLYVGEIYNLQLKSSLLCLSACETGIGKFSRGEGILGLGRAFTYAGADKIMVSLWKVNDQSTATLMTAFYNSSFKDSNEDYSAGIRQAKLQMIQSNSAPFYWAPFVLWGN